ncbi:uncharacterized protein [Hyperolius riggenbachi]|uniref:uncharacterized protein isoform X2 n=1 Tax=Hyperolius riggenbachi TaxID=752182 RepID=UPI0035A30072
MKFFILFMLVGLGHCLGDVPQAVECTKQLLAASPAFIDAVLKGPCSRKGEKTAEEKKETVDYLSNQIKIEAGNTGCTTKSLSGVDLSKPLENTGLAIQDTAIQLEKLLSSIGLTKELLNFTCKLAGVVMGSDCYKNVLKILNNAVKGVAENPLGNIVGLLDCQAKKGKIDLQTFANLLVEGKCLDLVPDLVGLNLPILDGINTIALGIVNNLLDSVTGVIKGVACLVGDLAEGLLGGPDGLLTGVLGSVGADGSASVDSAGTNAAASGGVSAGGDDKDGVLSALLR